MTRFDRAMRRLRHQDESIAELRSRLPIADVEHAGWDVVAGLEQLAEWADGSIGLDELGGMDGLT